MEQIIDWDSVVDDALFGFVESPPFLPPFSDSTILTFPPQPPCGITSSLHSSPERHHSSSDLYIHELPQPPFEQIPFIVDPIFDPAMFTEFEAPEQPSNPSLSMEKIIDWDSVVDDALFGFVESPPFLPPFSDSTILTFPPPPPCGISSSLHSSPERHYSSSDLYIQELPQPPFEHSPFIVDPALFAEFEAPQQPSMPMVAPVAKSSNGLTEQSMAARKRRKRISEKTLDLGRLIPGGNRMNTAEMFQAAIKYVKYLEAQHGVLQLLGSISVCKSVEEEHLSVLLGSTVVQQKLSAMGLCMVPKEIVDELSGEEMCIALKEIEDEFVVGPQIKSRRLGS